MESDDCKDACQHPTGALNLLEQFATCVSNFSSQYGSLHSLSYDVCNLVGAPSCYPQYGDFSNCWSPRTYGCWWRKLSSFGDTFGPPPLPNLDADDFVELEYEHPAYVTEVRVYETYNPGSVVRIMASDNGKRWHVLWRGESQSPPLISRIFSPPVVALPFQTRYIRLELKHRHLQHYPQIDAVAIIGSQICNILHKYLPQLSVMKNIEETGILNSPKVKVVESLSELLDGNSTEEKDYFSILPVEILLHVFQYLDLVSLSRCASVCCKFYNVTNNAFVFRDLNLKPYGAWMNAAILKYLMQRCKNLKRLDMSWCNTLTSDSVEDLLKRCRDSIMNLRMDACQWLERTFLFFMVVVCPHLRELSLSFCNLSEIQFLAISNLKYLRRLNLCSTKIDVYTLKYIFASNPNLQHVQLGGCTEIHSLDEVIEILLICCPDLRSLDVWKVGRLTSAGVVILASFSHLEELELGWCLNAVTSMESLNVFLRSGKYFRKLGLSASRFLSDAQLTVIGSHCHQLEQLELVGNGFLSPQAVDKLIQCIPTLQLLDISSCPQLKPHVQQWKSRNPHLHLVSDINT